MNSALDTLRESDAAVADAGDAVAGDAAETLTDFPPFPSPEYVADETGVTRMKITMDTMWSTEAEAWVASCRELPGLHLQMPTLDGMVSETKLWLPDMLKAHAHYLQKRGKSAESAEFAQLARAAAESAAAEKADPKLAADAKSALPVLVDFRVQKHPAAN